MTRNCVTVGMRGVPVGAQIAWLSISSTGIPFDKTRVAPLTHCAVTQGPPAGGGNVQPAMTYGAGSVTMGWPLTNTRGFGAVGCACPACEQSTVAPRWSKGPGMMSLFFIPCQTIVSAPLLMVTEGPIITIEAPLPFWM